MESAPQTIRALLVEDQEEEARLLLEALRRGGYAPSWKRVQTEPALRAALAAQEGMSFSAITHPPA